MTEQTAILNFIEHCWISLPDGFVPPRVWIRQYAPLAPEVAPERDTINFDTQFPQNAWLLDESGLRDEDVWKWQRFITSHSIQPWSSRIWPESSPLWKSKPREFGLAAFAQYEALHVFYVEMIWDGTFASGLRVRVQDNRVKIEQRLWLS